MFPNPVQGPIHPLSWQRPAGNLEFKVTSPFGSRVIILPDGKKSTAPHNGLDIGNGRAGANVLAQASGLVVEARPQLDGVITIQTPDRRWRLVLAHMTGITVGLGSRVSVGQVIGKVGNVGVSTAAHLHFENKEMIGGVWVPRDPWLLLNQNTQPEDDVNLKGTPLPLPGSAQRMTTVTKDGLVIVADPTAMPYTNIGSLPAGKSVTVDWQVKGNPILGSDLWYGFWSWTTPPQFGYISAGGCEPLTPMTGNYEEGYNDGLAAAEAAVKEVPEK